MKKKYCRKSLRVSLLIIILIISLVYLFPYTYDDWAGSDRFEYLKEYCEVVYLDRTEGISTTQIKNKISEDEKITQTA